MELGWEGTYGSAMQSCGHRVVPLILLPYPQHYLLTFCPLEVHVAVTLPTLGGGPQLP